VLAVELEVDLAGLVSMYLGLGVFDRVPVPIGWICEECHSRRQPDVMMQCRACLRWFHRSFGGAASSLSVGHECVCSPRAVCGSACLCM
jgi:hypothetical protein